VLRIRAGSRYYGAIAALALASAGGVTIAGGSLGGAVLPGAHLLSTERLMAMLESRSPGERSKGELAATKLKRKNPTHIAHFAAPRQRALGKVVQAKAVPSPAFVNAITPPVPVLAVPKVASAIPFTEALAPTLAAAPLGVGGLLIPSAPSLGGGGGGGGGVTPSAPVIPAEVVTPAVPEPSTWMMMLLGFGGVGIGMRRRGDKRTKIARTA
jgi:PEP-CTERM motif